MYDRRLSRKVTLWGLIVIGAFPGGALAQSVISGQVKDTTGAVLPGVTVEASSPVLIEKARLVGTDDQGRYSIVDLRPGLYSLSFSLSGFNSVKRDGIEVASNVNVPVNVELKVGALEETVTVSGQTPVVDVQAAIRTAVLSKTLLDALPTGRQYMLAGAIIPGINLTKPDVGGTQIVQQAYVTAHAGTANDNSMLVDGMDVKPNNEAGNQHYPNFGMMEEVTYQTSALSAETSSGGVRINMIPREGGNRLSGGLFFNGARGAWQSNNITEDLILRGLKTPSATDYIYDLNPGLGGPIVKNRLWLFASYRRAIVNTKPAGAFYKDGSPAIEDQYLSNASMRLTWQASQRNKVTLYYDRQFKGKGHDFTDTGLDPNEVPPGGIDPVTASGRRDPRMYYIAQAKWTSPISHRLLFETGLSVNIYNWAVKYQRGIEQPRGTPEWYTKVTKIDFIRGTETGASNFPPQSSDEDGYQLSSTLSYVTGSHNFKTGMQWKFGPSQYQLTANGDLTERFRNGVADAVDVRTTPTHVREYLHGDLGIYVQDSWTLGRLTINPGLRLEYLNASIEPTAVPAGRFVPARQVERVACLPCWFDVAPRFNAAYDLSGNAKTALKVSAGKYMRPRATGIARRYNPTVNAVDRRNWFDCDLIPGTSTCSGLVRPTNGNGIAEDNEIGPSNVQNFGFASSRHPASDLRREYNWQYSVAVQHELMPRVSVTGGWFHLAFKNVEGQYNTLLTLADYATFEVASPLDGQTITIYNLNRAKQGLVDIVDRNSSINHSDYNAFDVSVVARLSTGAVIQGGWATERTVTVSCDTSNPNQLRYCDQTKLHIPFRQQFKLAASYPLPRQFHASVSLLSYPGAPIGGSGTTLPTAGIAPSINWVVPASVFPGGRTQPVTVPLVPPASQFLDRWSQLDFAANRVFHRHGFDIQPQVEVYNLLNSSVVLGELATFGPSLYRPTSTLQGRLLKLGVQVKF
jgi:hypothetical protein